MSFYVKSVDEENSVVVRDTMTGSTNTYNKKQLLINNKKYEKGESKIFVLGVYEDRVVKAPTVGEWIRIKSVDNDKMYDGKWEIRNSTDNKLDRYGVGGSEYEVVVDKYNECGAKCVYGLVLVLISNNKAITKSSTKIETFSYERISDEGGIKRLDKAISGEDVENEW